MSNTIRELGYLNGTRFCMVILTVLDRETQKVQLSPIRGVAKVLPDRLMVQEPLGEYHVVPDSALASIQPSDGTDLLKDAEFYVIVRVEKAGSP